jgi:hypothetical protein
MASVATTDATSAVRSLLLFVMCFSFKFIVQSEGPLVLAP